MQADLTNEASPPEARSDPPDGSPAASPVAVPPGILRIHLAVFTLLMFAYLSLIHI